MSEEIKDDFDAFDDEPTSDEWATGAHGRPAGELETRDWGETMYSKPQ